MEKNKTKNKLPISRNERIELKNQLSFLATNIKNRLNQNNNLNQLIKIKLKQISINKENLTKFSSLNSKIKNKKELENKIIEEIKSNNKELLSLNINLKKQIIILNRKNISLKNKFYENNAILINNLNLLKDRKFIYENAIKEKEDEIINLQNKLGDTFLLLTNELNKMEIFNDEENDFDYIEEFQTKLDINKDLLFNKCISFNKYHNIKTTSKKQILDLKKKLKTINKYINTLNNLNTNFDFIDFSNYKKDIYIDGEECMEERNDNNDKISNIEESFCLSNESSILETEEEINSSDFIKNSFFEEKTKLKLNFPIPKIDLTLINYNKIIMKFEDREKSLSRDKKYDKDIYSLQIRKIKNKIEECKEKKELFIEKINNYKLKIKELEDNMKKINSSPSTINSFRIKSIKKRKFLFNSTIIVTNNSFSRNIKNISSFNLDDFKDFSNNEFYN